VSWEEIGEAIAFGLFLHRLTFKRQSLAEGEHEMVRGIPTKTANPKSHATAAATFPLAAEGAPPE